MSAIAFEQPLPSPIRKTRRRIRDVRRPTVLKEAGMSESKGFASRFECPQCAHVEEYPLTHQIAQVLWEEGVSAAAVISEDGTFLRANPAWCSLVEYSEAELQSRTFQSITHPDDVADDVEMAKRTAADDVMRYQMLKRYITKRGNIIWIKLFMVGLWNEDGEFTFFLSQAVPAKQVNVSDLDPAVKQHIVKKQWRETFTWAVGAALGLVGISVGIAMELEKLRNIGEVVLLAIISGYAFKNGMSKKK